MNSFLIDNLNKNVDFLTKMRASIVICRADQEDFPIVFVNKAFEKITGYNESETLGRNCRFLQGQDTDQPELRTIRDALDRSLAVQGVVKNYNKKGEMFYNHLCIDPIADNSGKITHFIGCQNAISDPNVLELKLSAQGGLELLTKREFEILPLVASGNPNKIIARNLKISVRTVEKHRIKILNKFKCENVVMLSRCVIALGIPLTSEEYL
jgi:PAS domain S-box-containing protein